MRASALDRALASLVSLADEDTAILVASDHGARPLREAFCINEWLVREGYLVLKDTPSEPVPLRPELVDWARTRAWAEGGYYARVFLNVRGREPIGCVDPADYAEERARLAAALRALGGPSGERSSLGMSVSPRKHANTGFAGLSACTVAIAEPMPISEPG